VEEWKIQESEREIQEQGYEKEGVVRSG